MMSDQLTRRGPVLSSVAAIGLTLFASGDVTGGDDEASERPNVIIIYTDDHGYADLSCQGVLDDIRTPHTDRLAAAGVRFTAGYCTAPQCRPSRAGLLSGRYQNRFGLEQNGDAGLPWSERTIAERLADAGYITGMSGKWHLDGAIGSNGERPDGQMGERIDGGAGKYSGPALQNPGLAGDHGFAEFLCGARGTYVATHDAEGNDLGGVVVHRDQRFRIDVQAEWAASFIDRHARSDRPFFLYVPFFAPHVPLEAPEEYLDRFPGEMPRRRRLALAMLSAVDDGVALIDRRLVAHDIAGNTLIFYISDNGAPLKIHKFDAPGGGPGWDGSLNDPWVGEKGMLSEGGIRVPFIARWPDRLPAGLVYHRPVIALDATATAVAAAGLPVDDELDGVDLVPYLTGAEQGDPHEALYWRWVGQEAIRQGDWKYLRGGGREYLFDLTSKQHETENLIAVHAQRAAGLRMKLDAWTGTLMEPGPDQRLSRAATVYFDHYLDGKPAQPPGQNDRARSGTDGTSSLGRTNGDRDKLFRSRDRNRDGFVTLEEYIGNPDGRNVPALTRRFGQLDANNDERLTRDELVRPAAR